MTECRPGDIVLLRFPFTDQQSAKKRPALVVSPPDYQSMHGDIIALALTTKPQPDTALALNRWQDAGLPKKSWIKPVIGSFASSIVDRKLGEIVSQYVASVHSAVRLMLAGDFTPSVAA